jgi:hypothetical protein
VVGQAVSPVIRAFVELLPLDCQPSGEVEARFSGLMLVNTRPQAEPFCTPYEIRRNSAEPRIHIDIVEIPGSMRRFVILIWILIWIKMDCRDTFSANTLKTA